MTERRAIAVRDAFVAELANLEQTTSSLMTAVNLLTTVFLMRTAAMTMWRLPIFTWNMVVVAILGLVAFPPAVAGLSLLLIDRRLGGHAFDPLGGRDSGGRSADFQAPADVAVHGAPREERELLKDHAAIRTRPLDRTAVNADLAAVDGAVVFVAYRNEVPAEVGTAPGAEPDVVRV